MVKNKNKILREVVITELITKDKTTIEKLKAELKVDFSSYDEMFLQTIDSLILLHFGKEGYEVISFYLYEKNNCLFSTINDTANHRVFTDKFN